MSLFLAVALSILIVLLLCACSPYIIKTVLQLVFRKSSEEISQKNELMRLNEEIKEVPMIDEFPKYARLERKVQKLTASISKISKDRTQKIFYGNIVLRLFFHLLQVAFFMWILYFYRYEKVLNINPRWTSPFHHFLSFNTATSGFVCAGVWTLICRSSLSRLIPCITELL